MNAFDSASDVEARAMEDLLPFLESKGGRAILTAGETWLSMYLQTTVGDALVSCRERNGLVAVEFKVEESDDYGNFFLETWSNRQRFTLGWMYKLRTDVLWYYFLASKELYSISFERLRKWAFHDDKGPGRVFAFNLKKQKKRDQMNDTWGHCVPIENIKNEVGFRYYSLNEVGAYTGIDEIPF